MSAWKRPLAKKWAFWRTILSLRQKKWWISLKTWTKRWKKLRKRKAVTMTRRVIRIWTLSLEIRSTSMTWTGSTSNTTRTRMETIAVPRRKKKRKKRRAKSRVQSVKVQTKMINKLCHSLRTTRDQLMITQVSNSSRMLWHQLHFLKKQLAMQILLKLLPKMMLLVECRPWIRRSLPRTLTSNLGCESSARWQVLVSLMCTARIDPTDHASSGSDAAMRAHPRWIPCPWTLASCLKAQRNAPSEREANAQSL